jgi:NADH-quinone oxidoreductase subunit F
MLGTACAIVLSDATDPVVAIHNLMRFYRHESCGQCTPCREGIGWIDRILTKIVQGEGTMRELDQLHEIGSNVMGNTICAFGEGAAQPILSFVRKYRRYLEDYIRDGAAAKFGSLEL